MNMPDKVTAKCSSCGEPREVEVWSRINVGENPELKPSVKDGSLFVWKCPHCGTSNLILSPALYHDPDGRVMIWLLPSGSVPEAQVEALEAQLSDSLEGYVLRRVDEQIGRAHV